MFLAMFHCIDDVGDTIDCAADDGLALVAGEILLHEPGVALAGVG